MIEYKGYNIPEKKDLKEKGVVVSLGGNLTVKISDDRLFDTGIEPTKVADMSDNEFNALVYSRATGYIDAITMN